MALEGRNQVSAVVSSCLDISQINSQISLQYPGNLFNLPCTQGIFFLVTIYALGAPTCDQINCSKMKLLRVLWKCIISMSTHSAIFKNGGEPTKPIILQLIPIPEHWTWHVIKTYTCAIHSVVTYANYIWFLYRIQWKTMKILE